MGLMEQLRKQPTQQPQSTLLDQITSLKQMLSGNPQAIMTQMMQTNPQFAQFVAQNQGKTPEQAFADNGLDISQFKDLL